MFSSLPILNRRTFLKGMGLVGAAGLLSACGGSSAEIECWNPFFYRNFHK